MRRIVSGQIGTGAAGDGWYEILGANGETTSCVQMSRKEARRQHALHPSLPEPRRLEPLVWPIIGSVPLEVLGPLFTERSRRVAFFPPHGRLPALSQRRLLVLPPGTRMRAFLGVVFPRKVMIEVFEPTLADVQYEWQEAMVNGRDRQARWIQCRGYLSLVFALVLWLAGVVSRIVKAAK